MSAGDEMALFRQKLDALKAEMPERVRVAHAFSIRHRQAIESSDRIGCFYCLAIHSPSEIKDWVDDGQTALCPACGIDAVLPDSAVPQLDRGFLELMNKHWF